MENKNRYKLILCSLVTVFAAYLLAPTVYSLMNPDKEKLPKGLPDTAMNLGLDLKGGVHMVLGVDLESVVKGQLQNYGRSLDRVFESNKLQGVKTKALPEKLEIEVQVPESLTNDQVAKAINDSYSGTLDVQGEVGKLLVLKMNRTAQEFVRTRARDQSIETIRNRIDEFGIAEPVITRRGEDQILVQFPGAKEPDRLKKLIGQTAQLNFHIVHECVEDLGCIRKQQQLWTQKITAAEQAGNYTKESFPRFSEYRKRINADLAKDLPADTFIAFEKLVDTNEVNRIQYLPYILSQKNMLSGEYIEDASVQLDRSGVGALEKPVVAFRLNSTGAPLLGRMTTDFRKHFMAIVLDGVVRSAPVIQSTISDSGIISLGAGTIDQLNEEARDLSIVLRAGALPATIEVQEERIIGPSIGRDAIEAGKKALALAALLVLIFMAVYYGKVGMVAVFVTIVNVALIFAILGSLNATLTLPGIAGIVLTIGMAVDALIIIFERMREEIRNGASKRQVVELGFDRALSTILDANITTVIGAFILLNYGTGTIRGFAFTLIVGIVSNVFMSTFFMKTIFDFVFASDKEVTVGLSKKTLRSAKATR